MNDDAPGETPEALTGIVEPAAGELQTVAPRVVIVCGVCQHTAPHTGPDERCPVCQERGGRCARPRECRKVRYPTRKAAIRSRRYMTKNAGHNLGPVYRCPTCGTWHLTSQKPKWPVK